jgi:hypothetical protein
MADDDRDYEFDIAISYAGEDRTYVHEVAQRLRDASVRVFYAEFSLAQTWGSDLVTFFDDVFRRRAKFAMLFVSTSYVSKPWTRHERRSAQARSLYEDETYILPVRLDDAELPGLLPTIGYLDARKLSIDELVGLTLERLGVSNGEPPADQRWFVPRTKADLDRLLIVRPDYWEYLLFGGILAQGKLALEPRWRDHKLKIQKPQGPRLDDKAAVSMLKGAMDVPLAAAQNAMRLLAPDVTEEAFAPDGTAGDPDLIEHLGSRLIGVYEDLLAWAEQMRSTRWPDEFRTVVDLTVAVADTSLHDIRVFIDRTVAQFDLLPEHVAAARETGQRQVLVFELVLTGNDEAVAAHGKELKRLARVVRARRGVC